MAEPQGFQVLLVEDNSDDLWLMGEILRSRGHTVTACQDAESGWTAFRELKPRLLLLDYILPGMDGLSLCRKIRSHPDGADAVILVVTGRDSPDDLKEVLRAGADDYLAKPLDVPLLEVRLAVAEQRVRGLQDREKAQEALEARTREMESLVENLDGIFFSLDPRDEVLLGISTSADRILGIEHRQLMGPGKRWKTFLCPPELDAGEGCRWDEIRSGIRSFEYEITRPDAETRWVRTTLNPVGPDQGEIDRVDGFLTDVTVQKHGEEELSVRNRELESLYRISAATLASPDLDAALPRVLELILETTEFPCAFLFRFDQERDRLILAGQRGMPDPPPGPMEVSLHESLGGVAVETREPLALEDARDHPRFRNDPLRRQGFRSCALFPLLASDRVLGVLTLAAPEVREISLRMLRWGEGVANTLASFVERLEAEMALREGEARALGLARGLRQANEELEAFSYSVSHDLRAPLRTMQGFAQALVQEYGETLPEKGQDFLRRILASGQQAERLIADLLSYSRLSFEEMTSREVALNEACSDALEQVESYIRERDAVVEVPGNLPTVLAHHPTLVQVVANLLTNALKFVPEGRTPRVVLGWEEGEEETIRLWIEDNGPGIPEDQHERIFGAFERLEGASGFEGTGIGLAIVRRGMERIGGRAGVASAEGEGSRFWLEIPRGRDRKWRPWGRRPG